MWARRFGGRKRSGVLPKGTALPSSTAFGNVRCFTMAQARIREHWRESTIGEEEE
jgi:hypothetical protein